MKPSGNTVPELAIDQNDPSQVMLYQYFQVWKGVLASFPIQESFSDKLLITNIDGFTDTYSVNDVLPLNDPITGAPGVVLYKRLMDNWQQQQTINGVRTHNSAETALMNAANGSYTDSRAKSEYFDLDAAKRIVIFGHTHIARLMPFTNLVGKKTLYANSGTWIDRLPGFPNMTCAVVTQGVPGSPLSLVNIYKFNADKSVVQWYPGQAIVNN
jgi:hypothetical protein